MLRRLRGPASGDAFSARFLAPPDAQGAFGAACSGAASSNKSMNVSASCWMRMRTGRYCSVGANQTSALSSLPGRR